MYGFEYYIVDKKYNWILCENHHDILIVLGEEIANNLCKYDVKKKPIGVIENIFETSQKGLNMVIKYDFDTFFMDIGDQIKLVKPNGREIFSKICGISDETKDILVEEKYSKKDVPIGTELWLIK